MALTQRANEMLASLTGYRVTRATPARGRPSTGRGAQQSARNGQSGRTQRSGHTETAARTEQSSAGAAPTDRAARRAGAGKRPYPKDFDAAAIATIEAVRPRTMTSNDKLFALISATRYVTAHEIPGDVVECGVWRGGSMQAVARTLCESGDTSRELYLFDTFEGMPPPSEHDVRHDGAPAAHLLETTQRREGGGVWAYASLEDVQQGMAEVAYPQQQVHFRQGRVEDTIPAQAPERIAILRLDTDWYSSTKHELDHLYDRLVPGGVLLIDDYGYWQGSRTATDEFMAETGAKLLLLRMSSGRIAVKPRT